MSNNERTDGGDQGEEARVCEGMDETGEDADGVEQGEVEDNETGVEEVEEINIRARKWLVTINNYLRPRRELTMDVLAECGVRPISVAGQYEIGENGTPHLHLALRFRHTIRGEVLKTRLRGCFGVNGNLQVVQGGQRGWSKAFWYCLKEETRDGSERLKYNPPPKVGGVGTKPQHLKRFDCLGIMFDEEMMHMSTDELLDYYFENDKKKHLALISFLTSQIRKERDRIFMKRVEVRNIVDVEIYYGWPGSGKSYRASTGESSLWNQSSLLGKWFGTEEFRYANEEVLLIDEFSGYAHGKCPPFSLDELLRMMDRGKQAPLSAVKRGVCQLNYRKIVITSNTHPMMWFRGTFRMDPMKWKAFARRVTKCLWFPRYKEDGSANMYLTGCEFTNYTKEEDLSELDYNEETFDKVALKSREGIEDITFF